MKTKVLFFLVQGTMMLLCFSGCSRNRGDMWEDTKTAGRHVGRGFKRLGGKHGDSRQINSRNQFMGVDDEFYYTEGSPHGFNGGVQEFEFVPLSDADQLGNMGDSRHSRWTPGDPNSPVPGIEAFQDPSTIPGLAGIFRDVHFEYNSSLVKGPENFETVQNVAVYLKKNPNAYIFVEGHCDERGPEAFNLALGANRSNSVRNLLIQEGANADNIFTVSYGKERPKDQGHDESAWTINRRSEFKIYQR